MKPDVKTLFVTNLLYGVIALIPIAIVVFVVVEVFRILGEIAKPLALHSRFAAAAVVIAGLVGLVVLCFLLGSLVRTRLGSTTFDTMSGGSSTGCRSTSPWQISSAASPGNPKATSRRWSRSSVPEPASSAW